MNDNGERLARSASARSRDGQTHAGLPVVETPASPSGTTRSTVPSSLSRLWFPESPEAKPGAMVDDVIGHPDSRTR